MPNPTLIENPVIELNGIAVADTFAEAFTVVGTRAIVTAVFAPASDNVSGANSFLVWSPAGIAQPFCDLAFGRRMGVIVYKVGGSLLDLPCLSERLLAAVSSRAQSRPLLVVGGGAAADLVRDWDRIYGLGDERAHWLALKSLELNESLLESLLPRAVRVTTRDAAERAWRENRLPILGTHDFLRTEETTETQLPHSWAATSDSIAAWVAVRWPADELVLLKSVALPAVNFDNANGLVDECFMNIAAPRVGWINLRDPHARLQAWPVTGAASTEP